MQTQTNFRSSLFFTRKVRPEIRLRSQARVYTGLLFLSTITINTFPSRLSLGVTAPKGVIPRNVPNTQHNIFCTKQAQQDKNRTSWLIVWSVKFRLICFLRCVSWRWGFILTLKFSIRVAFCRKTETSAKTLSLTVRNRILILEVGLKLKSLGLFSQDRLWATLLSAAFRSLPFSCTT